MSQCPCGNSQSLEECCGPFIKGEYSASTPEELMRSRYVAFTQKNMDYIFETTDPQARHDFDREGTQQWADESKFIKLEVLNSRSEGNKGFVEFKAHYQNKEGQTVVHHEQSKFRSQGGIWYFRDGKVVAAPEEK